MKLVSRAQWGARSPRGTVSYLASAKGVKVHYTGGHVDPGIVKDHAKCVALVRQIQRQHMDGNGWVDIGYSLAVCPHRYVFVGRGPHRLPAANGPGLNAGHYAVLGLVGSSGLVEPPDEMLHGIRDAIEYLRKEGNAGNEIKGHRDGYATLCPGDRLYRWVREGAPRPKGQPAPASKADPEEETWREALMRSLPDIKPGMGRHQHVKTVRALLHARGYPPKDIWSHEYREDDEDLKDAINRYKARHGLPQDGVWGRRCWEAALD